MSNSKHKSAIFFSLLITLLIMISSSESKIKKASSIKKHPKNSNSIIDNSKFLLANKESNCTEIKNPESKTENAKEKSEIKTFNTLFLQNETTIKIIKNETSGEKYNQAVNIQCNKTNCFYPNFCNSENKICICGLAFAEFDLYQINKTKANNNNTITNTSDLRASNLTDNSINTKAEKIIFCAYERKRQTIYFLLEFLLNVGAGHFYAKNYLIAALKFGLVFIPWSFIFVVVLTGIAGSDFYKDIKGVSTCFMLVFICLSAAWWITDAVLIGKRFFSDGNGVSLLSW